MITRNVTHEIQKSLRYFQSVLLTGPRQVGKSTVLKLLKDSGYLKTIITLDDILVLSRIKDDPEEYIKILPTPLAIVEIKRCPEVMITLKKIRVL